MATHADFPQHVTSLLAELNQGGKFWVVGGACRDAILGNTPHDFDFTTTTPEVLEGKFPQVGKDFPVYLVKANGHSYEIAAARTEKKTGVKHTDFDCTLTSSLEEDLLRRDLTVNSIAWRPEEGFTFAPGSQRDLEAKVLRHTTDAFREDPLRVMRVARFAATLGWPVHNETVAMCQSIADTMPHLVMDRVKVEFTKAMASKNPQRFLETLRECGCLDFWFPEIAAMIDCTQSPVHHPEGDVFTHTMLVMKRAAELSDNPVVVMSAMAHDFGKPIVKPLNEGGKFHGHDKAGVDLISAFGARFSLAQNVVNAMSFTAEKHHTAHNAFTLRPGTLVEAIKAAKRSVIGLDGFLTVCQSDHQGRGVSFHDDPYPHGDFVRQAAAAMDSVNFRDVPNMTADKAANMLNQAVAEWKKSLLV